MAKTTAGKCALGLLGALVPVVGTLASALDAYYELERLKKQKDEFEKTQYYSDHIKEITELSIPQLVEDIHAAEKNYKLHKKAAYALIASTIPSALTIYYLPQVQTFNNLSDHTSLLADKFGVDQLDGLVVSCAISFIFTAWLIRMLVSGLVKEKESLIESVDQEGSSNKRLHSLFSIFGIIKNSDKDTESNDDEEERIVDNETSCFSPATPDTSKATSVPESPPKKEKEKELPVRWYRG